MRMLVTGGAGFIGCNFVRYTLAQRQEYDVVVLDALTEASSFTSIEDLAGTVEFIHHDVCDTELLQSVIDDRDIGVVVHFAAESHNDNSFLFPHRFVQTNVMGTAAVLEVARWAGTRIHHVSTDEVYGDLAPGGSAKFNESTPYNPTNYYSASKAASDHIVRAAFRQFEVAATLSHCTNNFGPYQNVEKFIPRQITNILEGAPPRLHGDGRNIRDWMHVEDHCSAIHAILDWGQPGEEYSIGIENEWSNADVLTMIMEIMGHDGDDYEKVPNRPRNDRRYATDPTKIREECGWRPKHTGFRDSLADTVKWYLANRRWWADHKGIAEARFGELGR